MAKLWNVVLVAFLVVSAPAGAFEVVVKDKAGRPVQNVAVALYATRAMERAGAGLHEVQQQNKTFDPFVSVVKVGTTVTFPNKDSVKHDVYSFSSAKRFELPLFHGDSKPVIFDRPGVVEIGCNIHDWMLAYIVVVDTPYFGKTDEKGRADIGSLAGGNYTLKYWYPGMKAEDLVPLANGIAASSGHYEATIVAGNVQRPPAPAEEAGPYGSKY